MSVKHVFGPPNGVLVNLQGHLPSYLSEMVFHMRSAATYRKHGKKLPDVLLSIAAFKFVPGLLDLHAKCRNIV
jgi:hypothetical protein